MPRSLPGLGGRALRGVVVPSVWGREELLRSCLCVLAQFDRESFLIRSSGLLRKSVACLRCHDSTDGELDNAACPSIAAEDLISLLEYSDKLNLEEEHQPTNKR